jgi:hypothetical protein
MGEPRGPRGRTEAIDAPAIRGIPRDAVGRHGRGSAVGRRHSRLQTLRRVKSSWCGVTTYGRFQFTLRRADGVTGGRCRGLPDAGAAKQLERCRLTISVTHWDEPAIVEKRAVAPVPAIGAAQSGPSPMSPLHRSSSTRRPILIRTMRTHLPCIPDGRSCLRKTSSSRSRCLRPRLLDWN